MNHRPSNAYRTAGKLLAFILGYLLLVVGLAGCDLNSVDSTTAVPSDAQGNIYNFAGLYMNSGNTNAETPGALVYPIDGGNRPSGRLITWMRLLQSGSVIEAYDSAGQTWQGKISGLQGRTAAFSLRGRTTAGQSVEIAGTLTYADNNSRMDATWIEPNYSGNIFAEATVSPVTTNRPSTNNITNTTSRLLPERYADSHRTVAPTWRVTRYILPQALSS